MDITLLKLGGSLITNKSKPYTAKPEVIQQVLQEIKEEIHKNPNLHIIIGHGAGSFAHQSAKKHGTVNGFTNDNGKFGACAVHTDAMKLHQIVSEEAMKLELPLYSLQPSAFILSDNKKFHSAEFAVLYSVLQKGMIPMIYGDVIIDTEIGATIFSTDTLFSLLVNHFINDDFKIVKIIHAGNYNGVLDENGKVIAEINDQNFSQIESALGNSEHTDVTGGMIKKVEESMSIAKNGVLSHIINGRIQENISKALNNDYSFGTRIVYK